MDFWQSAGICLGRDLGWDPGWDLGRNLGPDLGQDLSGPGSWSEPPSPTESDHLAISDVPSFS